MKYNCIFVVYWVLSVLQGLDLTDLVSFALGSPAYRDVNLENLNKQ